MCVGVFHVCGRQLQIYTTLRSLRPNTSTIHASTHMYTNHGHSLAAEKEQDSRTYTKTYARTNTHNNHGYLHRSLKKKINRTQNLRNVCLSLQSQSLPRLLGPWKGVTDLTASNRHSFFNSILGCVCVYFGLVHA
jgi:hypothetical protein